VDDAKRGGGGGAVMPDKDKIDHYKTLIAEALVSTSVVHDKELQIVTFGKVLDHLLRDYPYDPRQPYIAPRPQGPATDAR
jgi:hypothetical protein